MRIINNLNELKIEEPTAVALGKFDGIHVGHMKLLNEIVKLKQQGYKALVFTFDIQAASFFSGKDILEITTVSEKRLIFEELGIDILVEFPLNKESASTLPEDFIKDILVNKLNMKHILAGYDVTFGYKGRGNADLLKELSEECNYEVNIIDKVVYDGREISSTMIRDNIASGKMDIVTKLLGHPYSFAGTVSTGQKLGRTLGMPTMNQYPDREKILPPFGVYYSNVIYEGLIYRGITNIGIRPTVSNEEKVSVETYLYDFDKDMYGAKIVTQLLEFKRPEMKFEDKTKLALQMKSDLEEGRKFHNID